MLHKRDSASRLPAFALAFFKWSFARGLCARGWWLVASVYLVLVAKLGPAQLVLLGTGAAFVVFVAEVPAGVFADVVSRKWSIALGHVISAAGMVLTGLTTNFASLFVAQALWALGWAFTGGADVAWITDELDRPQVIDRVLAARARWELIGAALGLVVAAIIAAAAGLTTAVVAPGVGLGALAVYVVVAFPETAFRRAPPGRRWRDALRVARKAVRFAREDSQVASVVVAWLLVNGAGEGYSRLVERGLVNLGFEATTHDVVRFAALALVVLLAGALVLRLSEVRLGKVGGVARMYAAWCAVGAVGIAVFAVAPGVNYAIAAVFFVSFVAHPGAVVRAIGEIWVNRRTAGDVRATVHSVLSQAEHLGEFTFGLMLASVAGLINATASMVASAALLVLAAIVVLGAEHRD